MPLPAVEYAVGWGAACAVGTLLCLLPIRSAFTGHSERRLRQTLQTKKVVFPGARWLRLCSAQISCRSCCLSFLSSFFLLPGAPLRSWQGSRAPAAGAQQRCAPPTCASAAIYAPHLRHIISLIVQLQCVSYRNGCRQEDYTCRLASSSACPCLLPAGQPAGVRAARSAGTVLLRLLDSRMGIHCPVRTPGVLTMCMLNILTG